MYAADACCVCTFLRLPGSRAGGSCSDGHESGGMSRVARSAGRDTRVRERAASGGNYCCIIEKPCAE